MPTLEGGVLADLLLTLAWLLGAESPENILLSSGTRCGDSYPLGTQPLLFSVFPGCSRSSASRVGGSGELLTAGTPLERVSSPHGCYPPPHQRRPRRSIVLLGPERRREAVWQSPQRRRPPGKASLAAQR